MIQYIIAAGIGAFLGSQSKKSKKSYAHGGEVDYGEIRERLQSLDLPTDAGDRTELVEEINLRYGIVCSEVIRASSDDDIYIAVDGLLRDYGVYAERGDDYAKGGETKTVYDNRRKTLEDMVRQGDNEVKSAIRAEKAGKISTAQLHEKQATVEFFRKKLNNLAKGGKMHDLSTQEGRDNYVKSMSKSNPYQAKRKYDKMGNFLGYYAKGGEIKIYQKPDKGFVSVKSLSQGDGSAYDRAKEVIESQIEWDEFDKVTIDGKEVTLKEFESMKDKFHSN